jgi:hypothetical protein
LEKNEDREKTAENLMAQITMDLNKESARTEEVEKTEENQNKNLTGDGPLAGK